MKLVLYHETRILQVFENIRSPVVDGNNVSWEDGSITDGLFLLLDDEVDVIKGQDVIEFIALDQKTNFIKLLPVDETAELKKQLADTNALILDFMESILV